jgi:hypothetical protein
MSSIDTPDTLLKKADKIQTRFILGALLAVIDLMFLVIAAGTSFLSFCAEKLGATELAHGLNTFSLATYLVTIFAAFVIVSAMAVLVIKILLMQKSLIGMSKKMNKDAVSLRLWLQNTYGVEVSEDESKVLVAGGSVHTFMGELSVIGQDSSFLASFNDELR